VYVPTDNQFHLHVSSASVDVPAAVLYLACSANDSACQLVLGQTRASASLYSQFQSHGPDAKLLANVWIPEVKRNHVL
jgi:hypothetical protein